MDFNTGCSICHACKQPLRPNVQFTNCCAENLLHTQGPIQEPAPNACLDTNIAGLSHCIDDKQTALTKYFYPVRRKVWLEALIHCMFSDEVRDFSVTEEEKEAELTNIHISMLPRSYRSVCYLKPGPWNDSGMTIDLNECLRWASPWGSPIRWSPAR